MGRFLTRDPFPGFAFDPISQHPYVYGRNNPVNLVDHSGLLDPDWLRRLIRELGPDAIQEIAGADAELIAYIIDILLETPHKASVMRQVAVVRPGTLVPTWNAPRPWVGASGVAVGGLLSGLFQHLRDLDLCLTPGQRWGRTGIATLEGLVIGAGAGWAAGILAAAVFGSVVAAPALLVVGSAMALGFGMTVVAEQANEAWIFPLFGLDPHL